MKRRLSALALAALLCLSGCSAELTDIEEEALWPVEQALPEEDAPLSPVLPALFALPCDPTRTLDPITCPDGEQRVIASLLCEGLFRLDAQFRPQPCLCESWERNEAATVWKLKLREGVCFSDGSPLTALDVRASLLRARDSARYAGRLSGVQGISAYNKGRLVTVTLSAPNAALPALLDIPIVKSGAERSIPIGTGPYLYAELDNVPYLVASQNWWQGDGQPTDRIALVETAGQDTVLYRFTSHDVQLITADLTGGGASLALTGTYERREADTTSLQYLICNTARPLLDSAAFRRCLSLGLNREYLVSACFSGHARAAQFPLSPAAIYPAELETPYSAAAFASAAAAFTHSFAASEAEDAETEDGADDPDAEERGRSPLVLLVNAENAFKAAAAGRIAEAFSAAGIPTQVRALPWEEYAAAAEGGDFDLCYAETRLQPDWDLGALLGTGGSLNYGAWSSAETDRLLATLRSADDRAAAMEVLCRHLQSAAPILPVCFDTLTVLTQSEVVEDLVPTASEPFYNLTECTLHLAEENA